MSDCAQSHSFSGINLAKYIRHVGQIIEVCSDLTEQKTVGVAVFVDANKINPGNVKTLKANESLGTGGDYTETKCILHESIRDFPRRTRKFKDCQ
jgi:hypothetical protein